MGWDGMTCSSKLKPKSFEEEYEFDEFGLLEFHPSCVHSFILETLQKQKQNKGFWILGKSKILEEEEIEEEKKKKKNNNNNKCFFFPIFQEGKKTRKNKEDMILH